MGAPDVAIPDPPPGRGFTSPPDLDLSEALTDLTVAGIAAADPGDWTILFANSRFRALFPESLPGTSLEAFLEPGDPDRARDRLENGRPYRFEAEVPLGPRRVSLQVELRAEEVDGTRVIVIDVQDISQQKQAEYMLDSYSKLVERKARELEMEKDRVEKLLLNIMPRSVYEELKDSGTTTPALFDSASVLLADFAGFTDMAISRDPGALIAELNDIFTSFDRIVEHFHCERIKTIGDAYMAVAGLPEPDPEHEVHLARVALRMRRFIERRNTSSHYEWVPRIGLGSGPIIGSIVGVQKYVYDIFGPTVNLASRLEHLAEPMQILVSADTYERIKDDFILRPLGPVQVKGFGEEEIYALEDEVRAGR